MNYELIRRLENGISTINRTIEMMEEDEALVRDAIGGELQKDCIEALKAARASLKDMKNKLFQLRNEQEQLG